MMGNVHEKQEITCEELRQKMGVKLRTWQARWKSRIGTPYNSSATLTANEAQLMQSGNKQRVAPCSTGAVEKQTPTSRHRQEKTVVRKNKIDALQAFNMICVSGVIAHAILVWFDCATLWSVPGFIGGCVAFLIIVSAVLLTLTDRNRTASTAVSIAVMVDLLAWFVHYPTFVKYANVDNTTSACFAAFLCLGSASLIYLFKDGRAD